MDLNKNTYEFSIESGDEKKRLDKFIKEKLNQFSRNQIQKWIDIGAVLSNSKKAEASNLTVLGQTIQIEVPLEKITLIPDEMPLNILFEDKYLIVINKPAGWVTHPAPGHYRNTLANAIAYYLKDTSKLKSSENMRIGIVHRLDKDTSGILVVAKTLKIQDDLMKQFHDRTVEKTYRTIVKGTLSHKKGEIVGSIGKANRSNKMAVTAAGRFSKTNFKVIKNFLAHSYLEVYPQTGRTHQIRVHLMQIQHPVLGDSLYGEQDSLAERQMLHAYQLKITHPVTKKRLSFMAKLPKDFEKVLRLLTQQSN